MRGVFVVLLVLISTSAACTFEAATYNLTGIVCRMTKPAALVLNQQTAQVIQAAFRHATYPDISGEKSMVFLGKVAYGLTNIQINDLSIENSDVDFKEDDAIDIEVQNVTASFKGTLSYGYTGAWLVKLSHSLDFEIESSIDLRINTKLTCAKGRVATDASDCYLTFHKLVLHLQGDKQPGWLKRLFTDFISFTLKLVLKRQVCKEINFLAQLLADFIQDRAANFLQDGAIGVDISLTSFPVIKANYMESHHKGLLLYKNYSVIFNDSLFAPSLLSESRMLYFWFSDHVLNSLALAAFLDGRLVLTITGEELREMFEMEDTEAYQGLVQEVFQGTSYDNLLAKVWSLTPPQITLQPEGTIVKSSVAVELSVLSQGAEPTVLLYSEKEVTVTIQSAYVEKKLVLHLADSVIEPKSFKCAVKRAGDDRSLRHFLQTIISVAGIPEVISRIEPALTSLMNSKGLDLFEIKNPEIITKAGYLIIQLDFGFPHHLLVDFLKKIL
ncbi:cholesteryl ester transfer protein [Carettochelys insculpta]|uniref:cholesteryl ester transfer protein n=1 Tax=Carettochelys insculpta TaxID=44489 RepID=UPI003EBC2E8A